MIKTILVPATGGDGDAAAFAAALAIARRFDAHIDVLHVKLDPVEAAVAMTSDSAAGTMVGGFIEGLEKEAAAGEARARRNFDAFCTAEKLAIGDGPAGAKEPSTQWHVKTGQEPRWFVAYGMSADLIVTPRGSTEDPAPRSLLEAVLLESGRPVLIPAASAAAKAADSVAIGWKAEPQCTRAVAAAMPFLAKAKTVTVMDIEEDASGASDGAERLVRNLAWHGIRAALERLEPGADGAAATLLSAAAGRAGLLVMGGYGHNRLREWVFGGFTQRALASASVPVLMMH